jgi:katanin p60 ATPase-containing subunit A1
MVQKLLSDRSVPDIDYHNIAIRLEGYSGSDIRLVCKEAAMIPLRRLLFQL